MLATIVILLMAFLAYVTGSNGDFTSVWIVIGIGLFLLFAIGVSHTADRAEVNRMHYWAYGDGAERSRNKRTETKVRDAVRKDRSAPVQVNVNVTYEGPKYEVKAIPSEPVRCLTSAEEERVRESLARKTEEKRKQWERASKESEMTKLFGTRNIGA